MEKRNYFRSFYSPSDLTGYFDKEFLYDQENRGAKLGDIICSSNHWLHEVENAGQVR